ncbi:FAD-binding oxidoreductase [Frondihabitans cladoniiphilus]|uniref:FAD-linked oxidase C-terminal domain-containing protein n=1 Tax=Frondihabitans cladoniiphilus TaxID=715785 RepID=A0ABP8VN92_9MICO
MTSSSDERLDARRDDRLGEALLERLRAALPEGAVVTAVDAIAERSSDRSGVLGQTGALAVVRPRTTAEVAAVLALANETRTPVVPQGALTGLAGAANAVEGAILLDLGRLDRILAIDATERTAVVQPGVIVADLQQTVAAQGLFYAPDPASAEWATVGGTIATNAGGMRALKYGVTRDSVRSLEVVLADGTVVRTRPDTVKGVASLDLTALVIGSEGTLAVVTEATLQLRPAPGIPRGVAATFADVPSALAAANAVMTSGSLPTTLELLDDVALGAIRAWAPDLGLPEEANAWVLAVSDAADGDEELSRFEAVLQANGAITVERAADAETLDKLLDARRALNPALRELRGASLNGDVAVPLGRLGEFFARLTALASERGVEISVAGHVGDGNLHPVVAFDGDDPEQVAAAHRAHDEILGLAQAVGGTMTGEHGVGVEKLPGLGGELSERVRDLQLGIKAVFDPRGILNPGKKFG